MLICDFYTNVLSDGEILEGVLGLESAGYRHGLNNYGITPVVLLADLEKPIYTNYIWYTPYVTKSDEDLVHIAGGLYVTSPERTICDLVIADGDEEFLYGTMDGYLRRLGTRDDLKKYAVKYNCVTQMEYRLNTLDEWIDGLGY